MTVLKYDDFLKEPRDFSYNFVFFLKILGSTKLIQSFIARA